MIDINTAIALNIVENDGGKVLTPENYKLKKNEFLRKQYNGFLANAKYASKTFVRENKSIKIHFIFSDKNEMNAYVSRLRSIGDIQYLIVCYSGIFNHIQGLFLWLMSSENVLLNIGRRKKRLIDFNDLSSFFIKERRIELSKLATQFVLIGPDEVDSMTKDLRNEYALLLTSLATEFLYFHEMTHIDHGHLDFLKNKNLGFDILYSTDILQKTPIQFFDKIKGIELEADLGASEYLFDSYWNLGYKGTLMRKFSKILKTNEDLLFALSFSLIWLFHLIQDYRNDFGFNITKSHPTPACRILSVFRIFYVLGKEKKGNANLIYEQFLKASKEYIAICQMLNIETYITANTFCKNSIAEKELIEVEEYRLEILEQMKPYQFSRKF